MKQRIFSALLAVCLIMVLLPGTAFAAAAVPSGNGNNFFANGTAITIADQKPDDAQDATLDGFTATGTDAYIIWEESGVKRPSVWMVRRYRFTAEATAAPLLLRYPAPASP